VIFWIHIHGGPDFFIGVFAVAELAFLPSCSVKGGTKVGELQVYLVVCESLQSIFLFNSIYFIYALS